MRIDYMQEFLILEKTRNFSEAAKVLHMSQSSLSKHIAALEDELDLDLFKRLGNSLQLTEAGSVFRDGAAIVVNDHNSLLGRMKAIHSRIDASIEIGYVPAVASDLIGPLYSWFAKNAPDVHLSVQAMTIPELQARLLDRTVHYAITFDFGDADERYSGHPIFDEEFFVVVPSAHKLASKPEVTRADLVGEHFLIPGTEMPQLSHKLDGVFGMLESYRNGTICRDVRSALDLVSAGRGIAMAGGHNRTMHPDLLFKPLADLDQPVTFPVSLIWPSEFEQVRSIGRHIAMLKAALDSIVA